MSGALIISLLIMLGHSIGISTIADVAKKVVDSIDFKQLLMQWMLSFLLFAGSLTIDFDTLKSEAKIISVVTVFGVILSTFLLGFGVYGLLYSLKQPLPLIICLLLGALISPTDPIAVLATFKKLGASKRVRVIVAGESLFNDGVGIVMFYSLLHFVTSHDPLTATNITKLFCQQSLGGILLGGLLGYLAHIIIYKSNDFLISILTTLTITTAGYSIASILGVSGPLAMVVAGIFIGNKAQGNTRNASLRNSLYTFWEVIDEVLNACLFLLLGLELVVISASSTTVMAGLCAIPLALLARGISVAIPLALTRTRATEYGRLLKILTWGGLKGGLAVALALSLPLSIPASARNTVIFITFSIVTFSILFQGGTIKKSLPQMRA